MSGIGCGIVCRVVSCYVRCSCKDFMGVLMGITINVHSKYIPHCHDCICARPVTPVYMLVSCNSA